VQCCGCSLTANHLVILWCSPPSFFASVYTRKNLGGMEYTPKAIEWRTVAGKAFFGWYPTQTNGYDCGLLLILAFVRRLLGQVRRVGVRLGG
jgi:hypothetical protein